MKITVRHYMENGLREIGFRGDECARAVNFFIHEVKKSIISRLPLPMEKKDGTKVLVNDCWETYADDYIEFSLDWLFSMVRQYSLRWCLNVLHSLK